MDKSIDSRLRRLEAARPGPLIGLFSVEGKPEPIKMPVRDAALPQAALLKIVGGNSLADLDAYLASFRDVVGRGVI